MDKTNGNLSQPNIGFITKCELQGPMSPTVCLGVKHILTMGESVRDEALRLLSALPLWEMHLFGSYKCLELWLERKTSTTLGP